jgi:O-antigen/teichoic acid export membrane protein
VNAKAEALGARGRASFPTEVALTLLARWVTLGSNVVSSIVVARVLGPGDKGILVLTFLLLGQVVALGAFGVPHALVYFLAGGRITRAEAVGYYLLASVVGGVLLMGPYALIAYGAGEQLFKGVDRGTLLAVSLLLVPALLVANAGGVLRGLGRLDLFNWLRLAESGLGLAAAVVALVLLHGRLHAVVVAMALAQAAAGAIALGLVLAGARAAPRLRLAALPGLLAFGVKSHLSLVLQMTERKVDMFLLGYLLTVDVAAWQIGLYSVAVALAELPRNVAGAVSTVLLPRISAADARSNAVRIPRVSRHLIAVNIAFALVLAAVAPLALRLLYGPAFLPAYAPFLLLLPGVVMAGVWNVLETELVGIGRPLRLSVFAGITLTLNVLLNLAAIPRWGILGAAATSGLTYALLAVCLLLDYRARNRGVRLRELVLVSRAEVAAYVTALARGARP